MKPHIPCPDSVRALLALFSSHGEAAYPVGGCVRDALMQIPPHDWDVAVTTTPDRTVELCDGAGYRTVPTGIAHGTVTVLVPTEDGKRIPVECTTCRTEGGYSDGRHPDAVSFTGRISDDLSRRDFTVNAMAVKLTEGGEFELIDLFGGEEDLTNGVIRCVGDPDTRFEEDSLRVLRAVRFAVKLGFDIEPCTLAALRRQGAGLARISRERISAEFQKILCSPEPARGVQLLCGLGLLPFVLPRGISPDGTGDLSALEGDFAVRAACLLWQQAPDALAENLSGLRLPTEVVRRITVMVSATPSLDRTPRNAREWRRCYGELAIPLTHILAAHGKDTDCLRELIVASEASGDCVRIADLGINGRDLTALGVRSGRRIGEILDELLCLVLDDPSKNNREFLLEEAKKRT